MTMNRITLVTLGVRDIARARAFYEALGWVEENAMGDVVFYDMGGAKFGLFQLDALAAEQGRETAELGTGAMTLAQNFGSAEEVDTAHARAVAAGAAIVSNPAKTEWGGYSGYVTDPDGHIWEFAHNPFWPLDSEGRIA